MNTVCRVRPKWTILLITLFFALSACTEVRFISDYDAATDEQLSQLQRDVETFFTKLERNTTLPACGHANHDAFYEKATVSTNLLISRNQIRTKNRITNEQLALLKSSLQSLEELHELADEENRCLNVNDLGPLRVGFNASFGAILKLELAKKRGGVEGSAN